MTRELKELLKEKTDALAASKGDFEAIYRVMFSHTDRIAAEDNNGFKIRRYTFSEVKEKCEKAAGGIYKAVGETHSFIGLEMENSVNWIAAFWGILKSGNKPYLINTRHPKELSDKILKTLGITKILSDKVGSLNAEYILFSSLDGGECSAVFEDEIAIATSATSLKESVCIYDGSAVTNQLFNTKEVLSRTKRMAKGYKGVIKNLAFLPFYHIFGLFAVYFWFSFFGITIVFPRDISPETLINTCKLHSVTHIFAVPMLWHTVEKKILKKAQQQGKTEKLKKGIRLCTAIQNIFPYIGADIAKYIMRDVTDSCFGRSVQFCISGGSFIRQSTLELMNGIGYPLHNGFGMSEAGITGVELRNRPKDRNKGSVGKPFGSVKYQTQQDGTLRLEGNTFCKKIITDGIMRETMGVIDTGDIFTADEDGYYFISGRKSDIVISDSGENINPDVIEKYFDIPSAIAFCVLGIPEESNEVLSMVVQVSEYISPAVLVNIKEYINKVNSTLPVSMQIKRFYCTSESIMSETAIKVSRKYLLRAIKEGKVKLGGFEVKVSENGFDRNSPLAKKVLSAVSEVLFMKAEDIDENAHFMQQLDMSSLQYFSLLSRLSEEFSLIAQENDEFCYTVREICEYIERHI